jgi:prepilin-type N-terminal cleavage/methylation domain-containing protein
MSRHASIRHWNARKILETKTRPNERLFKTSPHTLLSNGFSLIELVVVVAVLAILAAIAIPAFQNITHRARVNSAKAMIAGIYRECQATEASEGEATFTYSKPDSFTLVSADNSVNYLQHRAYFNSQGKAICHSSGIRANPDVGGTYPEFIVNNDGIKSCISGAAWVASTWQLGCSGSQQSSGEWQ